MRLGDPRAWPREVEARGEPRVVRGARPGRRAVQLAGDHRRLHPLRPRRDVPAPVTTGPELPRAVRETWPWLGESDRDSLEAFVEAGATHLIYSLEDPFDLRAVERLLTWRERQR